MKAFYTKLLIATVGVSLSLAPALRADDKSTEKEHGRSSEHSQDAKFLKEASMGGMAEVKMGELASQKGQSQSVKQFGERLKKDHEEANQKLMQIAQRKGMTQPTSLDEHHQKAMDHLSSLSGEEFDKAFIEHAVKDHKKDIQKFEKQAESGDDPAARSFARETLPTLREHLRIAQMLSENRNASIPQLNEPAGAERKSSEQQPSDSSKSSSSSDAQKSDSSSQSSQSDQSQDNK